jgi:hypothetical protein
VNDEAEYGLVMPFVVCQSEGGPYEDEAFVAGYDLGVLDTLLDAKPLVVHRTMRSESLPQVELVAMKHGYTVRHGAPTGDDDWTFVEFLRSSTLA